MKENIAIKINNLSKIYKNQKKYSLDNISLEIKSGIIFGLLGPNGAGKSTLINILADLVYKTSGTINIFGKDYSKELYEIKPRIGIVPQELNMDPFFTPYELLELQAGLYGVPKEKRQTKKILSLLALEDKSDAYARTLSGGMKRRLLIAKAMVHDPEILVLDEPTAGVDVELRQTLWENIKSLKAQGKTIIITTHYLHEAENLCDEIAIINKGKLLIADKTKNTFWIIFGFSIMLFGALIFSLGYISSGMNFIFFLSLLILAVGTYSVRALYFAVLKQANIPLALTGTAVGLISVVGYSPDIFAGPVMGYLLDTYSGVLGHQYVYVMLTAFSLIGLIASLRFALITKKLLN